MCIQQISEGDLFHDDLEMLVGKLQEPITTDYWKILETHFGEPKYKSLTDSVRKFVEGYDAADIHKASALALKEEWNNENIQGYRPEGGYTQLMDFLLAEIEKRKGKLVLSAVVKKIVWKENDVEVITTKGERFKAGNVLISVPAAVLKKGLIEFDPPLGSHEKAFKDIEVGGVVKFLVEFTDRVWETGRESLLRQNEGYEFFVLGCYGSNLVDTTAERGSASNGVAGRPGYKQIAFR